MPGRWGTRIAAICFIAISAYICAEAIEFPVGGGTFPLFAAGSAIVLCLVMLAGTFRGLTDTVRNALSRPGLPGGRWLAIMFRDRGADADARIEFDFSYGRNKPLLICCVSVLYVLAIFELGYFAATVLFLIGAPLMVGVRSPFAIGVTGVILLPAMYAFFVLFLRANLPKGILF
jgi:hypothetical protein